MKTIVPHILFLLFLTHVSYGQNTYKYSEPKKLKDGWKTNNLKALNVDSIMIYKLFNKLQNQNHKVHSILLVKNGEIIVEEYFGENSTNIPHDLRSATKSIISILMGIAIDKGFIESIDDPIFRYIKPISPKRNKDKRKETISIRHLLTMSSGLDCNDWDQKSEGQEDKVYKKKNWLQYTLDLPMINQPGTISSYCSMGTVLAAEIISQASGMTIDKFADHYLFKPLVINNVNWGHTSKKEVISSAKRLYMTSRDMAKIGQLINNKGKWNEKIIVSEKWIKESTSAKTKITGIDYGYFWWNIPFKINEKEIISTMATGNGGQYIMLFKEMNLIAVFTGGAYNSQDDKFPFAMMNNIFLPNFTNDK